MDWVLRLLWQTQEDHFVGTGRYCRLRDLGTDWAVRAVGADADVAWHDAPLPGSPGAVESVTIGEVTLTFALDRRAHSEPGWWCLANASADDGGPSAFAASGPSFLAWATRGRAAVVDPEVRTIRFRLEDGPSTRLVESPELEPALSREDLWKGSRTLLGEFISEGSAAQERWDAMQDARMR